MPRPGKFVAVLVPAFASAGTLYSSDFSSDLSPFSACNVKEPSSATVSEGSLEMYFDERDFDGTRNDKGVEICVFEDGTTTNVNQMKKEGWQGFNIKIPSDGFPTKKDTIIAQQFCPGGCSSWCGTLTVSGNSLVSEHRVACVEPTTATIVEDISRDEWHAVVVHMKVSQEQNGAYEVWWDGEQVYSDIGVDVGFGTWDGDELSSGWYFKNGQYCGGELSPGNSETFLINSGDHGLNNEADFDIDETQYDDATRTLLLENVKWYETDDGETDGYDTVSP